MATTKVYYKMNPAAYSKMTKPGGPVDTAAKLGAGATRDIARRIIKEEGRQDTGKLSQSIDVRQLLATATRATYYVGSALYYARFQHDGTANDGTGFIYPRRAKALRFPARNGNGAKVKGGFVFAKKVRGVKGIKFLSRAIQRLRPSDFH